MSDYGANSADYTRSLLEKWWLDRSPDQRTDWLRLSDPGPLPRDMFMQLPPIPAQVFKGPKTDEAGEQFYASAAVMAFLAEKRDSQDTP
jgi:hypothetical protein